MSELPSRDPGVDQSRQADDTLLDSHEKVLSHHVDEGGKYRLMPIGILFVLSGLILFAGTYLNRYAGHYDSHVYNETAKAGAAAAVVKLDPVAQGHAQFKAVCITCHQESGMGLPPIYPPLAGSEWVNGSPERVIRIVVYGLKGEVHVKGTTFNAAAMPVFGQVPGSAYSWSDDKIAAVLTYIRQEWGNKAPAITPEQVAAVRTSVGSRKEMSEAELQDVK